MNNFRFKLEDNRYNNTSYKLLTYYEKSIKLN